MTQQRWQKYSENYFRRFASKDAVLSTPLDPSCNTIIVIPCHNEPDLTGTLRSLGNCDPLHYPVEIIVVINQALDEEGSKIDGQNQHTIASAEAWRKECPDHLRLHLIKALDLPKKTAGVGLARKIGMDEALRRFASIDQDGAIVCLDADCRVSKNYLHAIEETFVRASAGVGEMYFEHSYETEENKALRNGIVQYELFLRYYVEGLRQSGFPNAIHTVGSCMLVKASTYAKHGGMNKRKAGEDFYFLHKIAPHEKFVSVNSAVVRPSCRTSDRVPFGTGKAQQDWIDKGNEFLETYDPAIFAELKKLLETLRTFYQKGTKIESDLAPIQRRFIQEFDYMDKLHSIRKNCKSGSQFEKQLFIWFDGFLCLKFVHFCRDNYYPNRPLVEIAGVLIGSQEKDPQRLLGLYRENDRAKH